MNVAVIGCGAIARRRHIPALSAYENVVFYAICDAVKKNADEIADQYHVKAFYEIDSLLSCSEIDAVIVCTPERFHKDNVIAALKAGKHILCEKPLAMNSQEAKDIIDVWKQADKTLCVAFSQRTYKVHQKAKELVAEGVIGKPIFFRTNLTQSGVEYTTISGVQPDFYDKNLKNIGGALLSVGCHRIDLVDYLFDSHIQKVQAFTPTIDKKYADGCKIDAEDHAVINTTLENGLSGMIWISWSNYGDSENETVIYGTEGNIRTFDGAGIKVYKRNGDIEEYNTSTQADEYLNITNNFLDVLTGKAPAQADGMDGYRCMKVIDAIKKSNLTGCWVSLD